jgi:hypothetical protein
MFNKKKHFLMYEFAQNRLLVSYSTLFSQIFRISLLQINPFKQTSWQFSLHVNMDY